MGTKIGELDFKKRSGELVDRATTERVILERANAERDRWIELGRSSNVADRHGGGSRPHQAVRRSGPSCPGPPNRTGSDAAKQVA